jgi:RimJ/RimL family protein N-acetyltransferase
VDTASHFLLITKRLLLRHFAMDDADAMLAVFGDAEVMRFGNGPQTLEWVQGWLARHMTHYERLGYGPYAVVERESNKVIGYCGLFHFPDVNGQPEVEIGYRLRRSSWGMGYATEAARAVMNHAFDSLSLERLIAIIDPGNTASIHVAQKLGMHYEADVMFEGFTHPDYVYSMISPDDMYLHPVVGQNP